MLMMCILFGRETQMVIALLECITPELFSKGRLLANK